MSAKGLSARVWTHLDSVSVEQAYRSFSLLYPTQAIVLSVGASALRKKTVGIRAFGFLFVGFPLEVDESLQIAALKVKDSVIVGRTLLPMYSTVFYSPSNYPKNTREAIWFHHARSVNYEVYRHSIFDEVKTCFYWLATP